MSAPTPVEARTREIVYDDAVVRRFVLATVVFGLVALAVGVLAATQLPFRQANLGLSWTSFGRIRPLHTNAAIFAFVGNMMFAGIYYSTQRLLKTRMASDLLSRCRFREPLPRETAAVSRTTAALPVGLTEASMCCTHPQSAEDSGGAPYGKRPSSSAS